MSTTETIRIVVFQEHGKWVGQCLERDVGAQADDPDTLLANLELAIKLDHDAIGPAPQHYFDLWDRCSERLKQVRPAPAMSWALCA